MWPGARSALSRCGRHGVPESDHAAVAHIARHVMLPLKIVPPFRQQYRAKRRGELPRQDRSALARSGLPASATIPLATLGRHAAARLAMPRADPRAAAPDAREPFGALDQFTARAVGRHAGALDGAEATVLLVSRTISRGGFLANRICVMAARPGRNRRRIAWCRSPVRAR